LITVEAVITAVFGAPLATGLESKSDRASAASDRSELTQDD